MLSRNYRLHKEKEIKRVLKYGDSFYSNILILRKLKSKNTFSRFSFIVGNKITKKSTQRNKIKRRLREIVRMKLRKIKPGYDCALIANPPIVNYKYLEIEKIIENLFKKAGLIR